MPLYVKCLKCGGWKQAPEHPTPEGRFPTAPLLNVPEAPERLCTCSDDAPADTA